jgi:chromosome segregation ATPase
MEGMDGQGEAPQCQSCGRWRQQLEASKEEQQSLERQLQAARDRVAALERRVQQLSGAPAEAAGAGAALEALQLGGHEANGEVDNATNRHRAAEGGHNVLSNVHDSYRQDQERYRRQVAAMNQKLREQAQRQR